MRTNRDDFRKPDIDALAKRAAYICSNPDCRKLTIAPSGKTDSEFIFIGNAAHITAAATGGPRFDAGLTSEQRSSIGNGIFLCRNCATMIDKNGGSDYPVDLLLKWKKDHDSWVSVNLNKRADQDEDSGTVIKVISHNQQGGITAGIINVGSQPRNLNTKLQNQLLRAFPDKEGDVIVTSTLGDGEAHRFATQIKDFLVEQGYSINGVNQAVFSSQLEGQTIDPEKRTIIVGTKT
ncbi:MAG: hypothetical protein FVQ83_04425 [Chloroflexi bacterium]|nr:hypothetical protein [Chloroflexota bacterium]